MTDHRAGLYRAALVGALLFLLAAGTLRESPLEAGLVALGSAAGAAVFWARSQARQGLRLPVLLFAAFCGVRYVCWRMVAVAGARLRLHGSRGGGWTLIPAGLVLVAEVWALGRLLVRSVQGMRPLRRRPVRLPKEVAQWPAVDVMITAGPEPLPVVRTTVLAALNMDWPPAKLRVFVLEREPREALQRFCAEVGCSYLAGGEGNAGERTPSPWAWQPLRAPMLAVLRADHVPVRSFLQITMGWMERDARIAVVQTAWPRGVAGDGTRLDRLRPEQVGRWNGLQDGLDLWGAVKFAGSAAVVRRAALVPVPEGAMLAGTQTGFELNASHWTTAYVDVPQVASAASEERQGVAGAPEKPGGTVWPRTAFLLAPAAFLLAGWTVFPGSGGELAAYGLPLLLVAALVYRDLEGKRWCALARPVAETCGVAMQLCRGLRRVAPQLLKEPEGQARAGPGGKGEGQGLLWLSLLGFALVNGVALMRGVEVLVRAGGWAGGGAGDVAMTSLQVGWAAMNLLVLGGALRALSPLWPQRRSAVRIPMDTPVQVRPIRGVAVRGKTEDASIGGVRLVLDEGVELSPGEWLHIDVEKEAAREQPLLAQVVDADPSGRGQRVGVAFRALPLEEEEELTRWLYGRADRWICLETPVQGSAVWRALYGSVTGYGLGWASLQGWLAGRPWRTVGASLWLGLVLAGSALLWRERALPQGDAMAWKEHAPAGMVPVRSQAGAAREVRPLQEQELKATDSGVGEVRLLDGGRREVQQSYGVPATEVVQRARLTLQTQCGPEARAGLLAVVWNEVEIERVPLKWCEQQGGEGATPVVVELPPELVVPTNELLVRLIAAPQRCRQPGCPGMWARMRTRLLVRMVSLARGAPVAKAGRLAGWQARQRGSRSKVWLRCSRAFVRGQRAGCGNRDDPVGRGWCCCWCQRCAGLRGFCWGRCWSEGPDGDWALPGLANFDAPQREPLSQAGQKDSQRNLLRRPHKTGVRGIVGS